MARRVESSDRLRVVVDRAAVNTWEEALTALQGPKLNLVMLDLTFSEAKGEGLRIEYSTEIVGSYENVRLSSS